MASGDYNWDGEGLNMINPLRVFIIIVLFPFLWIGVAVNFFGVAERLSFVPGISPKGGVVSGIVALALSVFVLAVILVVVSLVTGGGIPMIGGGSDDPTVPTTPTPEQTITQTPAPTLTQTSTSSPTPDLKTDLEIFESDFRSRLNESMQNESLTGVPVLSSEYRKADNGQIELWLVYWECDRLDSIKEQRVTIGNLYAGPAGSLNGEKPVRLRVYGVTNLGQYNDTITYINTSKAEALYYREIDPINYTENWNDRKRVPAESETDIAYQMVVNESGEQLVDEDFHTHHGEILRGPGGARDPTPPSGTNSNTQVSPSGVSVAAEPIVP